MKSYYYTFNRNRIRLSDAAVAAVDLIDHVRFVETKYGRRFMPTSLRDWRAIAAAEEIDEKK